jgi:serine/threonine protein kinase
MESIVRYDSKTKINLADFYANVQEGKKCPGFYRNANLLVEDGEETKEYLVLEVLGRGRMGFVFRAYHQQVLMALKMSCELQEDDDIFSSVKKIFGDEYKKYFLNPIGKTVKIDSFYLGEIKPGNRFFFDSEVFVTAWEPAEATLEEKLDEAFQVKLKWFRDFLKGLSIIHSRDRAHFDIKLSNLFLVNHQVRIGDFEFYLKINDFKASDIFICGTPGHIAPEIFYDREHITSKVDIFSAGIAFIRLFTGERFRGNAGLNGQEEKDMNELFRFPGANQLFDNKGFKKNFKISHFYQSLVTRQLETRELQDKEKTVYRLLLDMIEITPQKRPHVDKLLKEVNAILSGLPLNRPGEPGEEELSTEKYEDNSFKRLLQTHDKRDLIKFCLVPDLLEKLRDDKIKDKIMEVRFNGDDYETRFFSFALLEKEIKIPLFGKEISSERVKNNKEWNVLVIIAYWNKTFDLGLEKECDKKYIDGLLDEKKLDAMEQDLFHPVIKTTRKKLQKAQRKILEIGRAKK